MQGYKVYLLTLFVGFFAGVQSLRALGATQHVFLVFFSIGFAILIAASFFCMVRIFWYGRLVERVLQLKGAGENVGNRSSLIDELDKSTNPQRGKAEFDISKLPWWIRIGGCLSQLAIVSFVIGALVFFGMLQAVTSAVGAGWIGLGFYC